MPESQMKRKRGFLSNLKDIFKLNKTRRNSTSPSEIAKYRMKRVEAFSKRINDTRRRHSIRNRPPTPMNRKSSQNKSIKRSPIYQNNPMHHNSENKHWVKLENQQKYKVDQYGVIWVRS